MNISKASLADGPVIVGLVNSAYRGESSRKGWTTEADLLDGLRIDEEMVMLYLQESGSMILKCTGQEEQLLGCVHLKQKEDKMYLGMLTVSPGLQGQGIGKQLLVATEEKARELGCTNIVMTVISVRHELIDWYKRRGYVETGEKQSFPADERFGKPRLPLQFVVLEKSLKTK